MCTTFPVTAPQWLVTYLVEKMARLQHLCWVLPCSAGAYEKIMPGISASARQRTLPVWPRRMFDCKVSLATTSSLNVNTWAAYPSALNSYLSFCQHHNLPIEPDQTLTFYTVYMCNYIKPSSVASFLSGIISELKPYFPDVRPNCLAPNVHSVLAGMKCSTGHSKHRTKLMKDTNCHPSMYSEA